LPKASGRRAGPSSFWMWGTSRSSMRHRRWAMIIRTFCTLAAAIFALIALLHLVRIVMGWSVTLNGVDVPLWPSLVKGGKVQTEQMFSGLHLKADGRRLRVHAL